MDTKEFIELMKFKFKLNIIRVFVRYKNRVLFDIEKESLLKVASFLSVEQGCRFIIATGLDAGDHFEIIYHFSNDQTGLIANIRACIKKNKPEIESLTPLFSAADWIECEMHELLGLEFLNHPDMRSLLSEGNWGAGDYPMRKPHQETKK